MILSVSRHQLLAASYCSSSLLLLLQYQQQQQPSHSLHNILAALPAAERDNVAPLKNSGLSKMRWESRGENLDVTEIIFKF